MVQDKSESYNQREMQPFSYNIFFCMCVDHLLLMDVRENVKAKKSVTEATEMKRQRNHG